jgi:hypothetical protein
MMESIEYPRYDTLDPSQIPILLASNITRDDFEQYVDRHDLPYRFVEWYANEGQTWLGSVILSKMPSDEHETVAPWLFGEIARIMDLYQVPRSDELYGTGASRHSLPSAFIEPNGGIQYSPASRPQEIRGSQCKDTLILEVSRSETRSHVLKKIFEKWFSYPILPRLVLWVGIRTSRRSLTTTCLLSVVLFRRTTKGDESIDLAGPGFLLFQVAGIFESFNYAFPSFDPEEPSGLPADTAELPLSLEDLYYGRIGGIPRGFSNLGVTELRLDLSALRERIAYSLLNTM